MNVPDGAQRGQQHDVDRADDRRTAEDHARGDDVAADLGARRAAELTEQLVEGVEDAQGAEHAVEHADRDHPDEEQRDRQDQRDLQRRPGVDVPQLQPGAARAAAAGLRRSAAAEPRDALSVASAPPRRPGPPTRRRRRTAAGGRHAGGGAASAAPARRSRPVAGGSRRPAPTGGTVGRRRLDGALRRPSSGSTAWPRPARTRPWRLSAGAAVSPVRAPVRTELGVRSLMPVSRSPAARAAPSRPGRSRLPSPLGTIIVGRRQLRTVVTPLRHTRRRARHCPSYGRSPRSTRPPASS